MGSLLLLTAARARTLGQTLGAAAGRQQLRQTLRAAASRQQLHQAAKVGMLAEIPRTAADAQRHPGATVQCLLGSLG